MLAMHPECQRKVFEEVKSILPDQKSDISSADLSQLQYTNNVILETMRLNTPAPYITRTVKKDMQIGK